MQGVVRSVWDAVEFCCVAIPWREMIATPGEWELSELVRQQRIPLPSPDLPSVSEVRAFASLGARGPRGTVPATSWRAVAEDALDRWWRDAHGVTPKTSVRFENARSQVLRGVPRIRRGAGAGEFLETPARSSTPLERRGVSQQWIAAFVLWMHELRLFKHLREMECFPASHERLRLCARRMPACAPQEALAFRTAQHRAPRHLHIHALSSPGSQVKRLLTDETGFCPSDLRGHHILVLFHRQIGVHISRRRGAAGWVAGHSHLHPIGRVLQLMPLDDRGGSGAFREHHP